MKRVLVTQTALNGAPLDDLKQWLSITSDREDEVLEAMLAASIAMFETFTGLMPLSQLCEESVTARRGRISFATRPVTFMNLVRYITIYNDKRDLTTSDYEYDIDASGRLHVTVHGTPEHSRLEARFSAGMAESWSALDAGIKQGIIRLAAHYYRERDEGPKSSSPPASVAALWRPWREVRLT